MSTAKGSAPPAIQGYEEKMTLTLFSRDGRPEPVDEAVFGQMPEGALALKYNDEIDGSRWITDAGELAELERQDAPLSYVMGEESGDSSARTLPQAVIARWNAEDWDDATMTASRYTYQAFEEDALPGEEIELTEDEARLYSWGQCEDNLTGGSQRGTLREG